MNDSDKELIHIGLDKAFSDYQRKFKFPEYDMSVCECCFHKQPGPALEIKLRAKGATEQNTYYCFKYKQGIEGMEDDKWYKIFDLLEG